ncbi:MAG: glutaredoxin 3 [Proteobacteria bacterium]|nr:glutaredoxin 3 [Pseudomonadota bacterium]
MSNIIIYSKEVCPYCVRAKALLSRKGAEFTEIKITDDKTREEMMKKSGGRMTVPQIFIGDFHVGGCDDLYALDASGKLEELLKK